MENRGNERPCCNNELYDTPVVHIARLVSVGIVRAVQLNGHFSAPVPVSA